MVNRNGILSGLFRARTWVVVLVALQMLSVVPQAHDEAQAVTWDTPYVVASGSVLSAMAMDVEGDNIYCVYVQNNRGIYNIVMRWYDGDSWSSMLTVASGNGMDMNNPDVAVSDGIAHIVYEDLRDGDFDVMYRTYNGTHFSAVQQVSDARGTVNSLDPAIAADGRHVYVVWEETVTGDFDVMYRYIYDGRMGVPGQLSTDPTNEIQQDPAVAMDDGKAHMVWTDYRNTYADIYYRQWNGTAWMTETSVTPILDRLSQESPDIDVEGEDVYVAYRHTTGPGTYGIGVVTFIDGAWDTPTLVATPAGDQFLPQLAVEAGNVALVYGSTTTVQSAYFQEYDGQSWGTAEAIEAGDGSHIYYPRGVDLVAGRTYVMVIEQMATTRTHRLYVGDLDEEEPSAVVGAISPYWMQMSRISVPWSASDDYGLDTVVVQYRYSQDKENWDRWTVLVTFDDLSGKTTAGSASFSAPDGEGFYEFKAYATDVVGKSEAPSTDPEAEVALDLTAPWVSILINDYDEFTDDSHVSLNVSYSDVMTDLNGSGRASECLVELSNDGTNWTEVTVQGNKHAWDLAEGEGGRSVSMRVTDAAGLSSIATDTITVDLTDPNMTVIIDEGAEWTTSLEVDLTIEYDELLSGVAGIRITSEAIGGDEPWENPVETMRFTLPEGDGTATIYYQVLDNAGRTSEVHTATIGVDTVAPTGSIVINDGDDITDDPEVTLTLTYGDETSGVSQVRFSGSEFIGGDEPWENPVGTLEWDLGDTGGVMTVYYQVIDVAGMVSEVYSDTIILDTDKPTGTIALGVGTTITNSPSIMLALTGVDATTEVVGIRVSNEAIGGDEPWEGPVEALPWTLDAPDGEKTVYYQVVDTAGHVSQVYTLSLVLDTGNPYVEDTDPVDGIKDGQVDTSVVVRFSEAMDQTATSDATSMWTVDKDGNTVTVEVDISWSPDGRTMTIDPRSDLEPGTEYTWAISADATDVAGNQIYPAVENTLTTAGGGGDGDEPDADDGFGLLMVLVAAIVVIVVVVVGLVWWLSKR